MKVTQDRPYGKREGLNILAAQLKEDRLRHESRWREVAAVTRPDSPRWLTDDHNKGHRKDQAILDCTATLASQTGAAGMMAGITSPARPWFQLSIGDETLSEVYAVKHWLDEVSDRMRKVLIQSNFYKSAPAVYEDLFDYATAPMWIEEDPETVIWTQALPLGSYWVGADRKGRVNIFYREFPMTVRNLVRQFGRMDESGNIDWSKFSGHVKEQYQTGHMETRIDICHMVSPNENYRPDSALSKHKKFLSCYYELGRSSSMASYEHELDNDDRFLRESGYDYFPVLCPRWKVSGEDVYGTSCPGFTALGDNNQLQHGERRRMEALDQTIYPPLVGPTGMKRVKIGALGETTYSDDAAQEKNGWRAVYQIDPRFAELDAMQEQLRNRIKKVYFADLFLMMTESDRRQITAEEIRVRQQEKLLRVGPVLEQLNQDFLDPLIEITFAVMMKQGRIPEPPEELLMSEAQVTVQYVSIMAQAQKAIGLSSYHEFGQVLTNFGAIFPDVLDLVNMNKYVEKISTNLGLPAEVMNPPEVVAQIRAERAKAAQAQQATEAIAAGAGAAKDLAGASMEGDSALTRLLEVAKAGQLTAA